jgi:predicted RNA binding protein YcfA (HicA-like mRNA interferase family)
VATYSPNVWSQVRNCTDKQFAKALGRDGFQFFSRNNNVSLYVHPDGRQSTVHPHPGKSYGPSLLKSMLADAGWTTDADLRRVKLAK